MTTKNTRDSRQAGVWQKLPRNKPRLTDGKKYPVTSRCDVDKKPKT